jgi:hypothetical protein
MEGDVTFRSATFSVVMSGLDPGIHTVVPSIAATAPEWIAGSSPAMTKEERSGALRYRA